MLSKQNTGHVLSALTYARKRYFWWVKIDNQKHFFYHIHCPLAFITGLWLFGKVHLENLTIWFLHHPHDYYIVQHSCGPRPLNSRFHHTHLQMNSSKGMFTTSYRTHTHTEQAKSNQNRTRREWVIVLLCKQPTGWRPDLSGNRRMAFWHSRVYFLVDDSISLGTVWARSHTITCTQQAPYITCTSYEMLWTV